ncbi:hypothetical protein AXF42_Ash005686 [Apostasia shenzhenica]|uniref:VQ domain-containing protein n=1 Tax=Apostasia shenzhenica TaxID=1088818 RepID=A0A2I0BC24_9ASPA|nr:hypothetical protein AXF42_Ash005686 [Apostasia shenzhenica]
MFLPPPPQTPLPSSSGHLSLSLSSPVPFCDCFKKSILISSFASNLGSPSPKTDFGRTQTMEKRAIPVGREASTQHAWFPDASSTSSSGGCGGNGCFPSPVMFNERLPSPLTLKPVPRPVVKNPSPMIFAQADTSSFKQVVQMLTGCGASAAAGENTLTGLKNPIPLAAKPPGPKKPAFKLYERRSSTKILKMISPLIPGFAGTSNPNSPAAVGFSGRKQPEILSPSILDLPSLTLSPVTPLIPDPFGRSPAGSGEATMAEERAIAVKGFYFHPSPRRTPASSEPPKLLPLFPVTSPRDS